MSKKIILVTNDDGIESPGLLAAVEAVANLGEVIVVAPSSQQTAMSRALYGAKSEYLQKKVFSVNGKEIIGYHCNCSPAMIIQHAMGVLFNTEKPDLLVSGINYGENLGYDSMLSGTVGAAFQGAASGIPSFAVSLQTDIAHHFHYGDVDWEGAKYFLSLFAEKILSESLPAELDILKIDVPAEATNQTPWRVTKLARQHYFIPRFVNPSPENKLSDIVIEVGNFSQDLDKESDIYALAIERMVSVTPLRMDMTAPVDFGFLKP